MNRNFLSAFILFFTFSAEIRATDHLMFIGAGGEDAKKDSTIFDTAIAKMGKYVNQSKGLKVDIALNGGHAKTEAIINQFFLNAETKSKFQASDYQRLIKSYKSKLEKNEMVAGDQLMIYIDSHGAQKQKGDTTHSVATTGGSVVNFDTLSGSTSVNLDELKVLKELAKQKGVKLAIVDTSCHSGNTQTLADDNTCLISSTGPNHYGYAPFSQNFIGAMAKGKNLEDIFLEARKEDTTAALPMISTPSGKEATALLYENITPFLFHFDSEHDKLTPYLEKEQGQGGQCIANYNSLIEKIEQIEELNTVTKKILWWEVKHKKINLGPLKKLLANYEKSFVRIQREMKALGTEQLKQKEIFKTASQQTTYSWKDILTTDFPKFIAEQEMRLTQNTNPYNVPLFENLISVYRQADAKKKEILKNHPELMNVGEKEQAIKNSIDSNYFTAAAIGTEERKLYAGFYKKDEKPNACKNFKL